jgi:hypothetical protein
MIDSLFRHLTLLPGIRFCQSFVGSPSRLQRFVGRGCDSIERPVLPLATAGAAEDQRRKGTQIELIVQIAQPCKNLPVWSKKSCGLPVVVLQEAAQSLLAAHFAIVGTHPLFSRWKKQNIFFTLMVSLSMVW